MIRKGGECFSMLKELVSNMPSVSHNVNNLSDILSYKILVGINFIIQNYDLYLCYSVDYVGNQHYVFNIRGNNYRLVVVVKFMMGYVFIRFIGTHKEYDKIDCSKI